MCPLADSYVAASAKRLAQQQLGSPPNIPNWTLAIPFSQLPQSRSTIDSVRDFLSNLGRKISLQSGDDFVTATLHSDITVAILLHRSFV